MTITQRVSVCNDASIVLNKLRRHALTWPLKWRDYRDLMQGRSVRPDLSAHIGMNGRVVCLKCAFYHFPDPEGRWPPTLTLIAFAPGERKITDEEAEWIRDRFFGAHEEVRDTSKKCYRAYVCQGIAVHRS